MQVVEHQHHRGTGGQRDEELHDGVEQTNALLVWLQRHRLRNVGQALAQGGHQARQRRGAGAEVGAQRRGVGGARMLCQRLDERPVRPRGFAFVTPAPQHQRRFGAGRLGELLQRARLANAGLTRQQHQPAAASPRFAQPRRQPRQLRRAADKWRVGQQRQRLILLISDLAGGHRRSQARERQRAAVAQGDSVRASEQRAQRRTAQDLAGLRRAAQAARDHHGGAEVIGLVAQRLADVQPDADGQPLAGRAPARRQLHRDGAGHGVGGRGEHGQQAIAQPPHLLPAVCCREAFQQSMMHLKDALRLLVAGALQQLGGVHQIGKQQRHG